RCAAAPPLGRLHHVRGPAGFGRVAGSRAADRDGVGAGGPRSRGARPPAGRGVQADRARGRARPGGRGVDVAREPRRAARLRLGVVPRARVERAVEQRSHDEHRAARRSGGACRRPTRAGARRDDDHVRSELPVLPAGDAGGRPARGPLRRPRRPPGLHHADRRRIRDARERGPRAGHAGRLAALPVAAARGAVRLERLRRLPDRGRHGRRLTQGRLILGPPPADTAPVGVGADTFDPVLEAQLASARERLARDLGGREALGRVGMLLVVLAAGGAFAALAGTHRQPAVWLYPAFVVAYAVVCSLEIEVGTGLALPTELVLVPMLFLLPVRDVPLVVAAGMLVAAAPEVARGRLSAARAAVRPGSAFFSFGPALVFLL